MTGRAGQEGRRAPSRARPRSPAGSGTPLAAGGSGDDALGEILGDVLGDGGARTAAPALAERLLLESGGGARARRASQDRGGDGTRAASNGSRPIGDGTRRSAGTKAAGRGGGPATRSAATTAGKAAPAAPAPHPYLIPRPDGPIVKRLPGQANWPLRVKVAAVGLLFVVTTSGMLLELPWSGSGMTPIAQSTMRWPIVRHGSSGTAVRTVQYLLAARGYELAVDGVFGPQTERQVRRFQRARELKVDGIVGPQTWSALVVRMERGLEGYSVRAVQAELSSSGLPTAVDGIYGPVTEANVERFQRTHGIRPSGVVGGGTWHALARARPQDRRGVGFEAPVPKPPPNRSRPTERESGSDEPPTLPATK